MSMVDAPTIQEQALDAIVNLPPVDPPPAEAPAQLDPTPLADEAVHTDTWVVRLVVLGLMALALAVVVGEIVLLAMQRDLLPGEVVVIGGTAAGALGGVLASTRSTKQ